MQLLVKFIISLLLFLNLTNLNAAQPDCCDHLGGVHYCDSSAGRFVCRNGFYSDCYCDRHAVMDLQLLQGCCLWQGGVFKHDPGSGLIICNNGGISSMCSIQQKK